MFKKTINISIRQIICVLFIAFICILISTGSAFSATANLAWNSVQHDDLTGYRVYYGTQSNSYTASINVGKQTSYPVEGLTSGVTYYFAVTSCTPNDESDYSDEISGAFEDPGSVHVTILPQEAIQGGGQWRVDGGPWNESGDSVEGLDPGTHSVEFSTIDDWGAPTAKTCTIQSGQTTYVTGEYSAHDTTAPTIAINYPTSQSQYVTTSNSISLKGTASDNNGVSSVRWQSSKGGEGTAEGTETWEVPSIDLVAGANVLTITALDAEGNSSTDTVTVTYESGSDDTDPPADNLQASLVVGLGEHPSNGGWIEHNDLSTDSRRWARVGWSAYNSANGEARIATGDIDGDGQDEMVIGLGRVSGSTSAPAGYFLVVDGNSYKWCRVQFSKYNTANGETWPACGDVDGDGKDEIIIGLGSYRQNGGWLEIFDYSSGSITHKTWKRFNWSAYNAANGEVRPAAGDIDGDGRDEIIVGIGSYNTNGGWFEVIDDEVNDFAHMSWGRIGWGSYNAANGETHPACGDVDGDGKAEIVVGLGSYTQNGGWFEVFDYENGSAKHKAWRKLNSTEYNASNGETRPTCGDIDGDGKEEIVVGLGQGGAGKVEFFDDSSTGYEYLSQHTVQWAPYNSSNGATWPALIK